VQEIRISPWTTRGFAALASALVGLLSVACSDALSTPYASVGDSTVARVVAAVVVTPAEDTLFVGDTLNLSARATDTADATIEGRPVSWLSTDDSVATVSAAGVVKAIRAGTVVVRATVDGKVGAASLTIAPRATPVASIMVAPVALLLNVGQTRQLTAFVLDAAGNRLTDRAVVWSSDASGVAVVSAEGLVSATGLGYATITATCEGKTFSLAVTVVSDT